MSEEEWYYVIDKEGNVFQVFGNELTNGELQVAVLEYIFNTSKTYPLLKRKTRNEIDFYRVGIAYNTEQLKKIGMTKHIHFCDCINRETVSLSPHNIEKILTPHQALVNLIQNRVYIPTSVKKDLLYLLDTIRYNLSDSLINSLGVEGSLCFGVSHAHSDIDIIINGQNDFETINSKWKEIISDEKNISLICQLPKCQEELVKDRAEFIPYSKEDILFHENRKNYAYITINGQYRKINVVGKLNPKDPLYQERFSKYFNSYSFRPVGMYKVKGITQTERLGSYIPSIYDTDTLEIQPISDKSNILDGRETKIDYIIDYIGSYYLHLKKGELFEGVGMVEEIYYKGQPTGRYRLSLNPWDGHMINHMYLKTIHKGENRRTINDHLVVSSQKKRFNIENLLNRER